MANWIEHELLDRFATALLGEPPEIRDAPRPSLGRLSTEAAFQTSRLEADEVAREVLFSRIRVGKRIGRGPDHRVIGTSADLREDPGLADNLVAAINDATHLPVTHKPYDKPEDPVGIGKVNATYRGKTYIVCARPQMYPENGNFDSGRAIGRPMTMAEALVVPSEQWSVAVIPQLLKIMPRATPLYDYDFDLPRVSCSTDILDEALPSGWFNADVCGLLNQLLTGEITWVADSMPQEQFLETVYRAFLCLPEAVTRQISFVVGGNTNKPKSINVRIAHGAWTSGGIKDRPPFVGYNGSKWVNGHPSAEEGHFKEEEARQVLQRAKTPREVLQRGKGAWGSRQTEMAQRFFGKARY